MKKQLICEWCGKEFESGQPSKKTCSGKCGGLRLAKLTGRLVNDKISTSSVGAMSELFVCGELLKKGYHVFRSLSPSCFCDLVAIKNGETMCIEVRTGYIHPVTRTLNFPKVKWGNITHYAVYERNTGEIFWFDVELKEHKI